MLPPGLVQYCSQHSCEVAVKLFLQPFSYVVHPYSSIDTIIAWKKLRFILSVRSDFHLTDSLSIAVYAFLSHVSMSVSVAETLLPRYVNLLDNIRNGNFKQIHFDMVF